MAIINPEEMKNSIEDIVQKLSSFPERACSGKYAPDVLNYLCSLFPDKDLQTQTFKTPKNYLVIVLWLILGVVSGVFACFYFPLAGFSITAFFGISALLYFNWYPSPVTGFPPQAQSHNLIISEEKKQNAKYDIILMAHWDTAPVSLFYHPKMVANFRSSLRINLIIISLAMLLTFARFFFSENLILDISLILIALYFIIQLFLASFDFFRYGYSNGASDNATGIAAAVQTARNCWSESNLNSNVELVLTGAEEVGMIGSKAYFRKNAARFTNNTLLINFDTLGSGDLKIITKTGSWGNIVYKNILTETADYLVKNKTDLSHISTGEWHTADFDSVWFNRALIPTITLAALDSDGRMPNIHRETDTLDNVNFKPVYDAILLASTIIKKITHV